MIPLSVTRWLSPRAASRGFPVTALAEQLREECEAMARYALHHGLPVAPELIAQLGGLIDRELPAHTSAHHALAAIHRKLAAAIAPATPQAVTLLDAQHRSNHALAWLRPCR